MKGSDDAEMGIKWGCQGEMSLSLIYDVLIFPGIYKIIFILLEFFIKFSYFILKLFILSQNFQT